MNIMKLNYIIIFLFLCVGGDGLAAVYVKQSGQTDKIYYAHKDHLGSIVKLTDNAGTEVFKAAYDPWGNRKITNSTFKFHRGFTGHEHLPEFNLINMNGRLYDPQIGSFLSPDPFVQMPDYSQSFNRYAYCLNNPLKYTDPDGEFIFTLLSAIFCPALLPVAIQTDIGWITGGLSSKANGGSFWQGALIGGVIGAANGALSMISPLKIPFGNSGFGLNIAPQIAIGTDGLGLGFNATFGYDLGKGFNVGVNLGATYYANAAGTGASGFEGRIGYGINYQGKHFQAGIGSTYFLSGETSQLNGQIYAGGKNWKVTYENDTWAPMPGLLNAGGREHDRYRTAALRFDITGGKLKGFNMGLNIYTGLAGKPAKNGTFTDSEANKYRMGAIYVGYYNARIGYNSEKNIRGPVQNGFHDIFNYPHFEVLNIRDKFYFGFYSPNPYTVW
jgi:RHS repeat-associated protein